MDADEDYWNASSTTKANKQMNFFDDDADDSWVKLSRSVKAGAFDDDDEDDPEEIEIIGWNDELQRASLKSPPSSSSVHVASSARSGTVSFKNVQSAPQLKHSASLSTTTSASAARERSANSIEEAVGAYKPGKTLSTPEISKLQAEIQFLRRSLQSALKDRWSALPVDETVKRMMSGQVYSLEVYRSLELKQNLLDAAIKMHDGNAITAVVLFLRATLKKSSFQRELILRPTALSHYLAYLKSHFEFTELIVTLQAVGRAEEAAVLQYRQALSPQRPEDKLRSLQNSHKVMATDSSLQQVSGHLKEHCSLLDRQIIIEQNDVKLVAEGRTQMFLKFPKKSNLPNQSLITTLYYCMLYHFNHPEHSLANPGNIQKEFRIGERQYLYSGLQARARASHWQDIESLLTAKGWFKSTKLEACIGFARVVETLANSKAPKEILEKYLRLVKNPATRLGLAAKNHCHLVVIETLVQMKDKQALVEYRQKVPAGSMETAYLDNSLRNTSIKWKN